MFNNDFESAIMLGDEPKALRLIDKGAVTDLQDKYGGTLAGGRLRMEAGEGGAPHGGEGCKP